MSVDDFHILDLILPLEEYFELPIEDLAYKVNTLGELADAISDALGASGNRTDANLSARAFYRTRRVLVSLCSADRKSIRTDTRLDSIIPKKQMQETWAKLQEEFRSLGDLDLPKWANQLVKYAPPFSGVVFLVALFIFHQWLVVLACFCAYILLFAMFSMVIRVNFGVIPKCYETVGTFSYAMVPREAVELKGEGEKLGQREVWRIVQSFTAKAANINPDELTRETLISDICNPPKKQA